MGQASQAGVETPLQAFNVQPPQRFLEVHLEWRAGISHGRLIRDRARRTVSGRDHDKASERVAFTWSQRRVIKTGLQRLKNVEKGFRLPTGKPSSPLAY